MKRTNKKVIPFIIVTALVIGIGSFINIYLANPFRDGGNNGLQLFADKKDRINILVFGVDSLTKEKSSTSRSDTIMLFTIDSNKENPIIISIPRDTRVKIPGRKNLDKINHAHAYGGPELLTETVEGLLDISIDYYVSVSYNAVIELVDALGGVELDVPINMKYSDPYADPPLHIDIKKGLQVLNGQQSVEFLRFRKGYANQDLGRIQAQQQFISALTDQLLSPATVLKIPQMVDILYDNVDTNIPKKKMLSLALMASTIDMARLNKVTLEGTPKMINGVSYYIADSDSLVELKKTYFSQGADPINGSIEVLNGCSVSGIARQYADDLKELGVNVYGIGNYDEKNVELSFIEYKKEYKKDAEKLKTKLSVDKIVENNDLEADIRIVIGKDLVK